MLGLVIAAAAAWIPPSARVTTTTWAPTSPRLFRPRSPIRALAGGIDIPADGMDVVTEILDSVSVAEQTVEQAVDLTAELIGSESAWTLVLAVGVLSIGQVFEKFRHSLEHGLPRPLLPALEVVFGEMTSLGFSGLLISGLEGSGLLASVLAPLSERCLGEEDALLEIFEAIEHALFPTVVAFAGACAVVIGVVIPKFEVFLQSTQTELLLAKLADDARRGSRVDAAADEQVCSLKRKTLALVPTGHPAQPMGDGSTPAYPYHRHPNPGGASLPNDRRHSSILNANPRHRWQSSLDVCRGMLTYCLHPLP